ncbi:apolipoprotein N-acyltransferase [Tessaracoccus lubricantis]|uniref:Apolipoprotein N-acyltransferase n=1 Tax=Tessaracoccus lubricantis TaxID=545543 RepID=A0ABP9FJU7_9ACTN
MRRIGFLGRAALVAALAVASGIATGLGFEPLGWWPLTMLGVLGLALATRRARSLGRTAAVGLAYGLGLAGPSLVWMSAINDAATVGLIVVMASWYGVLGALLHFAHRTRWWPLLAAGSWAAVEFASATVPFGGFGWLRLAYGMVDSPLAGLLPLVGVAGLSFVTALVGNVVAWLALRRRRGALVMTLVVLAVVAAAAVAGDRIAPAPAHGSASVGWVQGGAPGGGVYGLGPARTITTNQAKATEALAAEVSAGRAPEPDFVVWPENSTDLDPGTDAQTGDIVGSALDSIQRPILVGAILDGPGPEQRRTASLWTEPDGEVTDVYVKRSIVPFGEWIPFRDILLPLIPDLRYVGAQSVAGTEPGLLDVELADGTPLTLGTLVCFDVAFDPVVHDLADADLLVVQSSNAMYQGTAQIEQQFAITRARAAELRREVLVVTTSGVSGLIDPYGAVVSRDAGPGAAYGVEAMPLRSGATPATWLARPLELAISSLTVVWLLGLAIASRSRAWRKASPASSG